MTKEARVCNGEKIVFSVSVAGKTEHLHVKNDTELIHIQYTKINSKCIKDLIVSLQA